MTTIISAQKRKIVGKKVKELRREGLLPAIIYGKEVTPLPITVRINDFEKLFKLAGTSTIFVLKLDGEEHDVLIKEVELDPISSCPLHANFYRIRKGEKIRVTVPLQFEGESAAVRDLDGILVTNKSEVEVECLPKDLPPFIPVDLSVLDKIDAVITIKDIGVPGGVEILDEPGEIVAVITKPKEEEEEVVVPEEEAVASVEVKDEEGAEAKEAEKEVGKETEKEKERGSLDEEGK